MIISDEIKKLNQPRDWFSECEIVYRIYEEMNRPSVRDLALTIGRKKSWVQDSLYIFRGLRIYPEYMRLENRSRALETLKLKIDINKRIAGISK
jgi:hypothetical protein